jgi:alkanesulfonate monooxygenase SsuD/methylene tetrahydromethanopterin reductase-like flavin-dependent oxidoreductase (luciferase family)
VTGLGLGLIVRAPLRGATAHPAASSSLGAVVELARVAEDAGYDAFFVDGSPARPAPSRGDLPARADPFVVLGAVAVSTAALRLGCLSSPPDERPPGLLAKTVSALDVCSDGRAVLGLQAPDAASPDELARLGEALEVCRALLRVKAPSFSGRFYRLDSAYNEPMSAHVGGGRAGSGIPLALEVPAEASGEPLAALLELAARFTELVVLSCGAGSDPAARLRQAAELVAPVARRAGRVDGGPGLVGRLEARGADPAALADRIMALRDAGASAIAVDWSAASPAVDDVVTVGKLAGALLGG